MIVNNKYNTNGFGRCEKAVTVSKLLILETHAPGSILIAFAAVWACPRLPKSLSYICCADRYSFFNMFVIVVLYLLLLPMLSHRISKTLRFAGVWAVPEPLFLKLGSLPASGGQAAGNDFK